MAACSTTCAWSAAEIINGFWQTTPDEGQPRRRIPKCVSSTREDTLYIGVVAYDRSPDIIVADSRRDSSLDETDGFLIILDTYRDRQNGFVFGTNPAGLSTTDR